MHSLVSDDPTFSVYIPAPTPPDEVAREAAARACGLFRSDLAVRLHELVMQARHAMHTKVAALSIVTGRRQRMIVRAGLDLDSTGRGESFCAHAVLKPGEIMIVPDTLKDERFAGNPLVIDEPRIRFYAGAPLVAPSGHALGTLCVFDPRPRTGLSEDKKGLLLGLAAKAMAYSVRA